MQDLFSSNSAGYLVLVIIALIFVEILKSLIQSFSSKMSKKYQDNQTKMNWIGINLLLIVIIALLVTFQVDISRYLKTSVTNVLLFAFLPGILFILILKFKILSSQGSRYD